MNEKEKTMKKWDDLGFLDGLKGHVKPEIAALFESQPSTLLKEKVMNEIEIKKDLYKSKAMAKFSHYASGKLYYRVVIGESVYQFPIKTVDFKVDFYYPDGKEIKRLEQGYTSDPSAFKIERYQLSEDLGETAFNFEIKGSDLIRWISKAIDSKEFVIVGWV